VKNFMQRVPSSSFKIQRKDATDENCFFLVQVREEGDLRQLSSAVLIVVCPTICPTFLVLSAGKRREDRKISRKIASLPKVCQIMKRLMRGGQNAEIANKLVGACGFEPQTPTVSR
jgi:hypothetical protein